jgi:hypothetical protein
MSLRSSKIERDAAQALADIRKGPALGEGEKRVPINRQQPEASFKPAAIGTSAAAPLPELSTRESRSRQQPQLPARTANACSQGKQLPLPLSREPVVDAQPAQGSFPCLRFRLLR